MHYYFFISPYSTHVCDRIFATPSVILRSSGSVGLSLIMWLLGATVALCGTAVYMELGTVSGTDRRDCGKWYVLTTEFIGFAQERGREELSRVHIQTTKASGHLHICHVCCAHRKCARCFPILIFDFWRVRVGKLHLAPFLANVRTLDCLCLRD